MPEFLVPPACSRTLPELSRLVSVPSNRFIPATRLGWGVSTTSPESLRGQVEMVAHEAIGMNLPARLLASLAQRLQEPSSIETGSVPHNHTP